MRRKHFENDHAKFLLVLCSLYDGEHYVLESDIRKKWKKCPSHHTILGFGRDTYFDYNFDLAAPGYIPTAQGLAFVNNSRQASVSFVINVATFVVSVLSLIVAMLALL